MATNVGITNAALALLGAQGINSLDEETPRARQCKAIYDITRKQVLRAHPWKCATKRTSIAADSDTPLFDYTYQYTLPSDFLKVLQVGELGYEIDHRIEDGKILTDQGAPLYFVYVYDNEDESSYDSLLTDSMVYAMASKLSYAVTGSAALKDVMDRDYQMTLKQARAVDGQDNPPQTVGDFPTFMVR